MMPNPFNAINRIADFLSDQDVLEGRFENNGDGNPIYIGYSPVVNASTADAVWYIQKIDYDGTAIVRKRLPTGLRAFVYSWDNRATYFPA